MNESRVELPAPPRRDAGFSSAVQQLRRCRERTSHSLDIAGHHLTVKFAPCRARTSTACRSNSFGKNCSARLCRYFCQRFAHLPRAAAAVCSHLHLSGLSGFSAVCASAHTQAAAKSGSTSCAPCRALTISLRPLNEMWACLHVRFRSPLICFCLIVLRGGRACAVAVVCCCIFLTLVIFAAYCLRFMQCEAILCGRQQAQHALAHSQDRKVRSSNMAPRTHSHSLTHTLSSHK